MQSRERPERYFDICDDVFLDHNCLIADITPIYCSLEKQTLFRIREGLTKHGFTVRVLFIARDPFSRTWSMHRMGIKRRLRRHPEQTWLARPENAHKNFLEAHLNDFQQVRTRYEKYYQIYLMFSCQMRLGSFSTKIYFRWILIFRYVIFCACQHQHPLSIVFVICPWQYHSHPSIFKESLSIHIRKHMNT